MDPTANTWLVNWIPAAAIERSDVCAVPAAAVVGEAMVALILSDALVDKFGGDSMTELTRALSSAADAVRARFTPGARAVQ